MGIYFFLLTSSYFFSYITTMILQILILISLLIIYGIIKTPRKSSIPGPKPYPIIGNMPMLDLKVNLYQSFIDLMEKYGQRMEIFLAFGERVILTSEIDDVKEVLVKSRKVYPKSLMAHNALISCD